MPIITITDIYSRIYEEIISEITREETELVDRAIASAISEVKMYLSRFDLVKLFGNDTVSPPVAATITDVFLKNLCVDVACWSLVKLGNVSIKYQDTKEIYEAAIKTLKNIQSGMAMPEGWPYKDTTGQQFPTGNSVFIKSTNKRRNWY